MVAGREEQFRLEVPLDASGVEGFKPTQPVKVAAVSGERTLASQRVDLDARGHGVARLTLPGRPRGLRVVVGPHDATDEEIVGLQTISVPVTGRYFRGRSEIALRPIRISAYYWWWWFIWCREFTIRGRVCCPDGTPVPGAKVCAYDVDWWWWWSSRQLIKCDTTDVHGSFEIKFRWCCGWWPWWWWRLRHWQLDRELVDRIVPVLERDPRLPWLFEPSATPSLAGFGKLLADERPFGAPELDKVDPGLLEPLRERLVARLPQAPELERFCIWPWWPWYPWWDCAPDVVFRVTQDCFEQNTVIVNEPNWRARRDIPTNLNVILIANDRACCVPPSHSCEDGECIAFTQACNVLVENIAGNEGASATTPLGYANPGSSDNPFGGSVDISGTVDCLTGVDYYEFEWTPAPLTMTSTWNAMPPAAAGAFYRTYIDLALLTTTSPLFPTSPIDGHNVFETLEHYEATHLPPDWGSNRIWLGSSRDVLMRWMTEDNFSDGTYYLRLRGWNIDNAGKLINGRVLKVCDHTFENFLVLRIDNRVVINGLAQHKDSHNNPCGKDTVHLCTNEPDTAVVAVTIVHQDGARTAVSACGNEKVTSTDKLQVDFIAYDPNGHLSDYSLIVTYDVNLSRDLLNLPGKVLAPAAATVDGVNPASQVGPNYTLAKTQGAVSPSWTGGVMTLTVDATGPNGAFPETCCYQLELRANKRTIFNCFAGHANLSEYSFGIVI
jgi:hypothetical protein